MILFQLDSHLYLDEKRYSVYKSVSKENPWEKLSIIIIWIWYLHHSELIWLLFFYSYRYLYFLLLGKIYNTLTFTMVKYFYIKNLFKTASNIGHLNIVFRNNSWFLRSLVTSFMLLLNITLILLQYAPNNATGHSWV